MTTIASHIESFLCDVDRHEFTMNTHTVMLTACLMIGLAIVDELLSMKNDHSCDNAQETAQRDRQYIDNRLGVVS
jgi:hypothetical protein